MIACKTRIIHLLPTRILLNDFSLRHKHAVFKLRALNKRGSMLEDMIVNRDKRKNWHLEIVPSKPKARAFDKIHKPHRRRAVLNALFISNITDVLSTSDVVPDILDTGIEISGVQISPCFKILNVFWQVPMSRNSLCADIEKKLAIAAPKIRAELISRNVMGHVPHLYFLRDITNARVAEFEEASKKLTEELKGDSGVVMNEDFIHDIYSFKQAKVVENEQCKPKCKHEEIKEDNTANPYKPVDMRSNVLGLDHSLIMDKVIASKKKKGNPQNTAVVSLDTLKDIDDLFSKIPGVCFGTESSTSKSKSRNEILKKFSVERRILRQKKQNNSNISSEHNEDYYIDDYDENINHHEANPSEFDYIEDETNK